MHWWEACWSLKCQQHVSYHSLSTLPVLDMQRLCSPLCHKENSTAPSPHSSCLTAPCWHSLLCAQLGPDSSQPRGQLGRSPREGWGSKGPSLWWIFPLLEYWKQQLHHRGPSAHLGNPTRQYRSLFLPSRATESGLMALSGSSLQGWLVACRHRCWVSQSYWGIRPYLSSNLSSHLGWGWSWRHLRLIYHATPCCLQI